MSSAWRPPVGRTCPEDPRGEVRAVRRPREMIAALAGVGCQALTRMGARSGRLSAPNGARLPPVSAQKSVRLRRSNRWNLQENESYAGPDWLSAYVCHLPV